MRCDLSMQLVENSVRPLLSDGSKILRGLFAEIGTRNQNDRIYPSEVYEPAYEKLIPKIKEKRLLGELDHPIDYDEVRLSNVSHAIIECEIVEKDGVKQIQGAVELLDTPPGLVAQALVKAGIPLGISSRGIGSTVSSSEGDRVTDLQLITYDLVAEPSFANAILSPDKSDELSDSLKYIESKLPLRESVESQPVRDMIHTIRESLINRKTDPKEEINIQEVELESLRNLVESTRKTLKSDTKTMIESRREIKELRENLREAEERCKNLSRNMHRLQDAYNALKESSPTDDLINQLNEEIILLQKQLAVEKRGMSYNKVSELLEGATTCEEIENRLDSLSSIGKKRQTKLMIDKNTLTEGTISKENKLSKLATIVSNV